MSLRLQSRRIRPRHIAFAVAISLSIGVTVALPNSGAATEGTPLAQPISADSKIERSPDPAVDSPLWVKAHAAQTPEKKPAAKVAVMLELDAESSAAVYRQTQPQGKSAASAAARAQQATIERLQNAVLASVRRQAPEAQVLYQAHSLLAGIAISTDANRLAALQKIDHVRTVRTIANKTSSNAGAVPLVGAPAVWQNFANQGEGINIGIIDSGIDFTHADFGGRGTVAAYDAAKREDTKPTTAIGAGKKIVGGYDFVGDDYNSNPNPTPDEGKTQPIPHPDPNPLDCNGHGSHVAGTAAGYGVTADGKTFRGAYDEKTPVKSFRIGPGVAPKASLYALKVFGCEGATNVIGQALDWAADPNRDGDPSDHLDVVNMSLGSDFGDADDPDSQAVQQATDLGVVVVVASGNAGDIADASGSPGNAPAAITVAATDDGYSIVDGLEVTKPSAIAGKYSGELSASYDFQKKPGVRDMTVASPLSKSNEDGCDPLSAKDSALVKGKIAWLAWSDNDDDRRCGSAARADNVNKAGAKGFLFAGDTETFGAGIAGNEAIPGMLLSVSAVNKIRPQLANGVKVTISQALHNSMTINRPQDIDKVAKFSSRGIHMAGNLKPDVAAPGQAIFSADFGTGNAGTTESGTSMATPVTSGIAALVKAAHPDWSPAEVKADLMNTADSDVFTGDNHSGQQFAPNRIGAGRVSALNAVHNDVIAFNNSDPGVVSVSFGSLAITDSYRETKEIQVVNKSNDRVEYQAAYEPVTEIPGVNYSLSQSTISLAPQSEQRITVTLSIPDPRELEKTSDPTVAQTQSKFPRQFLADASGRIVLSPVDSERPKLRVPVYAAPRPASTMDSGKTVVLPAESVANADVELHGSGVQQGTASQGITSVLSGYELLAQSGRLPECVHDDDENCIAMPSQRAGDIRAVGATTNAPAIGKTALKDGRLYVAINIDQPTRVPAGQREFDVVFDTNGDNKADAVLYTTRITSTDVLVAALVDLEGNPLKTKDGKPAIEALNAATGDIDTDIFDSDVVVLPVQLSALPKLTAEHSRIHLGVGSYDPYGSTALDVVGMNRDQTLHDPMSIDVLRPGVTVGDPTKPQLLYQDLPDTHVVVRRDASAYRQDHGQGVLVVHHHNEDGSRAQIVSIRDEVVPQSDVAESSEVPTKRSGGL